MNLNSLVRNKIFWKFLFLIILISEILFFLSYKSTFTRSDYVLHIAGFMILSTLSLDSVGLFFSFHFLLMYTLFYTSGGLFLSQTLWLYFLAVVCIFFTGRSKINLLTSHFAHFFSYFIIFNTSLYVAYSRCYEDNVIPQAGGLKAFILFLSSFPLIFSLSFLTEYSFSKMHDRETTEDFLWDSMSAPFRHFFPVKTKGLPLSDLFVISLLFYFIFFGLFYYFYNPSHLIMPSYCGD